MNAEALTAAPVAATDASLDAGSSRLAKNISMLAGGQLTTWILTAMWTIVVPRGIGPHGMGLLVTAWAAA